MALFKLSMRAICAKSVHLLPRILPHVLPSAFRATFIVGSIIAVAVLFAMSPNTRADYPPEALYDDVWRLVNSRFVDDFKNGQDWRIWEHRFDDVIETDEDAYVAIETMLASLGDRYTRFLDPEEFGEEGRSIKATLYGIGIQIGNRDDKLLIIAPMEGTPASKAGLLPNDEILEIDAQPAKGMSVKEAAKLIRGKKGTKVKLVILRQCRKPFTVAVERDEIQLKSISLKHPFELKIPQEMGYIRLSSFLSNKASDEFEDALEQLKHKKGYIIDLRSNPGGLLANAVSIADFFLDKGSIVSTVDRDGYKDVKRATAGTLTDKPLVVLIDGGSASASEILSSALRDNNRAVLVGETTFGKGLVQEINQLPGGTGVNITIQRYLTPNDTNINEVGVPPDIEAKITEEDVKARRDPQLQAAIKAMDELIAGKNPTLVSASKVATASKGLSVAR
ncbi:MAG: S41 family peptidase [Vampirovibrionales bacterium]|nr:S41 family peptidase [Vampirovibrionales bacterium]